MKGQSFTVTACRVLITLLIFVAFWTSAWAKTIRVNNKVEPNPAKGIYASLQECHDDERIQPGDVILVEGSITPYESLTCSKRLTIIGPGYLLTENQQTQANGLTARVRTIYLNAGSEGTTLIGLAFETGSSINQPQVSVNDVTIMRCLLPHGILIRQSLTSLIVLQNYFNSGNPIGLNGSNVSLSGALLKNNIFSSWFSVQTSANSPRVFAQVENNIFLDRVDLTATSFRNNIIASPASTVSVTSSVIEYNLVGGSQLADWPNNQTFESGELFVGLDAANKSPDGQYRLKSDSPYLTAGYNGAEPGVFGGSDPYVLSGIPPIPTIYELRADAVASKQEGLKVSIKAKINP